MSNRAEPILRAESLVKSYRMGESRLEVLRGISLEVRRDEILAIQGPSGAGKSTLLHILGLLDKADEGRVYIDGTDAQRLPAVERARNRNQRIGFVFQFYHLLKDLDAVENVCLPAMVRDGYFRYDRKGERRRALSLLDRVGLGGRLRHRPAQLSGGERQRVAIARALMNQPALLLCDEPTGNLDQRTSESILDLLWELKREMEATFVIVTHDDAVARRADRQIRVVDGRVV